MSRSVLDYFIELVQIDSESLYEGAIALWLQTELERLGAEVYIDKAGEVTGGEIGNVIGWLPGNKDMEPLFLCAHMDTVQPGKGVKPVIDGDIIRSESNTILGADDKCGIAMILAVLDEYKESGDAHAPLEIVFSVSEEIGLLGAKALDLSRLRSKRGYVLDGNKIGEVVKASPNQADWKAIIRGKSAHAGVEPEKGNNAIRAAAAAILAIKDGRIDEETTMNCGKICGGIATNIVCDEVKIAGEIRSHNENKLFNLGEEVKEQFQATTREYKCTLEFDLNISFQSTLIDENDELVKLSEQAFKAAGITQKLVINGGGSDANVFSRKGLQGIVVGIGMQKIHSINEYIMLDDLKRGRVWLKNVIELWSRR